MSSRASELLLKPISFYQDQGIQVLTEKRVVRLDPENKLVSTEDGTDFGYDTLFLASGLK